MAQPTEADNSIMALRSSDSGFLAYCGAYITLWQRLNGKNDKDLALVVNCHPESLYRLRRGKYVRCSVSFLSRIALATGSDLSTMVSEGMEILSAKGEGA